MRSFIAIELPQEAREALCAFAERLRKKGVHATWVKPDAMHLTLRFLGDISQEQCNTLSANLCDVLRTLTAPILLVRGVGAFPSVRKPSIVWAGIEVAQGDLHNLQRVVESASRAIHLPPDENRFHPHVTLARLRNKTDVHGCAEALAPYLADGVTPEFGHEFKAANVVLFSSTLTRHYPIHSKMEEFTLS